MSVVKGKRNETKLLVLSEAEKLANYTINMVTQEKRFPKRYRWIFSGKIGDSAIRVHSLVNMANAIYPKNKVELRIRIKYIIDAIAEITNLLSLISLCRQQRNINLSDIDFWLETATYEKTLLLKWREAHYKKFDDLPD